MAQMVNNGTQTAEERQMQKVQEMVLTGIQMYEQNPGMFSTDQVKELVAGAEALGLSWRPNFDAGRAVRKGLYEMGEGLTLGLLPNSWDPGAYTAGEQIAGGVGGLLGLAAPLGIAGKAVSGVRAGASAVGRGLSKGSIVNPVVRALKSRTSRGIAATAGRTARTLENALRTTRAKALAGRLAGSKWGIRAGVGLPTFAITNRMFDTTAEDEAQGY